MGLCQLIYFSERRDLGAGGIQPILDASREANPESDVTGVLLFNQQYFLQLLEGSRREVTATFCRVAKDPRHDNIALMSVHDIDVRDFPTWSMGYVPSTSPDVNAALREFLPTEEFTPWLLSASSVVALMRRVGSAGRLV